MQPNLSVYIKEKASALGFSHCGIAKAGLLEKEKTYLEAWLASGNHAAMDYMENHFEKRCNPQLLVKNAQSVIVLAFNYFPKKELNLDNNYQISYYAYGEDYHTIIHKKLTDLIRKIQLKSPTQNIRSFIDTAPILERAWAVKAGLGWIGKNTLLIIPKQGSFFFLAVIITDLLLDYDSEFSQNHCGNCSLCIHSCPTKAITSEKTIDARRCISYLTIEHKGDIPDEYKESFDRHIFGCDICQKICPWNRFAQPHSEPQLMPSDYLQNLDKQSWENLSEESFKNHFQNSALKRTRFVGLQRNITFVKK